MHENIFIAGNHRNLQDGMWVEHGKCQPADDKPSLKLAWSIGRVISRPPGITEARIIKFLTVRLYQALSKG